MAVSAEIGSWIDRLEQELQQDPAQEERLQPLKLKQEVLCLKSCFDEIVAALLQLASTTAAPEEATSKLDTLGDLVKGLGSGPGESFEEFMGVFLREIKDFSLNSREKEARRGGLQEPKEEGLRGGQEELSFDEYWSLSLHDGEGKAGDGQSDTRTIDLVEKSDDFNLKQRARSLLKALFEAWKRQREALLELVEKKVISGHRAQTRIANLFWGKERDEAMAKTRVKDTTARDKQQAVDLLVRKKLLASNFPHEAIAGLAKHLGDKLDRLRAEDSGRFFTLFGSFCEEVAGFLAVFTHEEQARHLMDELKPRVLAKLEKRMLEALDALVEKFSAHMQYFKFTVIKGQSQATVELPDIDWHWSSKVEDRLPYSECFPMRESFSLRYNELSALDRKPRARRPRHGRTSLPMFWHTRFTPNVDFKVTQFEDLHKFLSAYFAQAQQVSVFHRHGVNFNSETHLRSVYAALFTFLHRMTESLGVEGSSLPEEIAYILMHAELLQRTFLASVPHMAACLESEHHHFYSLKDKLTTCFIAASKKTWSDLLLLGTMEQNWMISQRFSRTPNFASKTESMECESLYCIWLFLHRKMRAMARVFRTGHLPLHHMLVPALKLYLEFFSEAFEILTSTATSVQRQEAFSRDVKLVASLIESVVSLMNNLAEQPNPDGGAQFTVRVPPQASVHPLDYVVLVRKLLLLRAHFRYFHHCLSSNGADLEALVAAVRTGLYRNRQTVSKQEDVLKSALGLVDQMKKEAARHSTCLKDLEMQTLHDASMQDSNRLVGDPALGPHSLEAAKNLDPLREQNVKVSSVDGMAQEAMEQQLRFDCVLEPVTEPDDRWLQKVEKHFAALLDHKQTLLEELTALAKQAGQEFVGQHSGDDLLSFSKKKDYLMRRAELLDKDEELSKAALEAKNKIRKLL